MYAPGHNQQQCPFRQWRASAVVPAPRTTFRTRRRDVNKFQPVAFELHTRAHLKWVRCILYWIAAFCGIMASGLHLVIAGKKRGTPAEKPLSGRRLVCYTLVMSIAIVFLGHFAGFGNPFPAYIIAVLFPISFVAASAWDNWTKKLLESGSAEPEAAMPPSGSADPM